DRKRPPVARPGGVSCFRFSGRMSVEVPRRPPREMEDRPGACAEFLLPAADGEFTSGDHPVDAGAESREAAGAMADLMLDERAQLAEGPMIFGDQEQRIVTESARAAGLTRQSAAAVRFGLQADGAGGVG